MDVKTAVAQAKQHIADLFADEGIQNLGLEEVDYDDLKGIWNITLGFSRPWDQQPRGSLAALAGQNLYARRDFKVVRIHDSGKVLSVKTRDVTA